LTRRGDARRSPLEAVGPHRLVEAIPPRRVAILNQFDLPIAPPALEGAFAIGSDIGAVVHLEIDELVDLIALREAIRNSLAML